MNKIKLIISLLLILPMALMQAGDLDRVGTTSGLQLLIPVGARSIALGGASLGNVSGAEAIYWNVAGMSRSTGSEFMVNRMSYIADIDVNYLATTFNGGNIGTFGFHIKSMNFGDIEITTEDEPDGTGINYSPTNIIAGMSYGRALTDRITAGVTGKLVYEEFAQASASAFAMDLGVQYSFGNNLRLGVVMKNVGTKMKFSGRGLERTADIESTNGVSDVGYYEGIALASDIPSVFSFGFSYDVNINEENSFVVNGAFSNNNAASDEVFGGVEYNFNQLFFLRGGYAYEAQSSDEQIFGATFGAGVNVALNTFHVTIDYAFRQLTDYFDSNNVFSVKLAF